MRCWNRPAFLAASLGVLLCALSASGCKSSAKQGAAIATPLTTAEKIKAIEDNPNIPPGAKADAIAALQGQYARGAAPGEAKPTPPAKK